MHRKTIITDRRCTAAVFVIPVEYDICTRRCTRIYTLKLYTGRQDVYNIL